MDVDGVCERPCGIISGAVLITEREFSFTLAVVDTVGDGCIGGTDCQSAGISDCGQCDVIHRGVVSTGYGSGSVSIAYCESGCSVDGDVLNGCFEVTAFVCHCVGSCDMYDTSGVCHYVASVDSQVLQFRAVVVDGQSPCY